MACEDKHTGRMSREAEAETGVMKLQARDTKVVSSQELEDTGKPSCGFQGAHGPADTLLLDFQPAELKSIKFMLF